MRSQYFKVFSIILTIICILLSLALILMKVSAFKNETKINDLDSKIISEVDYLDSNIVEALNKLNNISVVRYKVYSKTINKPEDKGESNSDSEQIKETEKDSKEGAEQQGKGESEGSEKENKSSQENSAVEEAEKNSNQITVSKVIPNNSLTETSNNDIKWDEITYIYENMYSVWPTIEIDLKKIGIQDESINRFNFDLNGVAQSINSKNKNSALVNLYNLYSQLPNYLSVVTNDEFLIKNYNCREMILNSYVMADEENKWKEMSQSIAMAKNTISEITEKMSENDRRKINLEKVSTIINDLENSIVLNDKNIFYMQYKNAIQALETL